MGETCCSCRDFLVANRERFGIMGTVPACDCLDICVQNVRLICAMPIRIPISLPGADDIFQNCRQIIDISGDIDRTFCQFRVTCAREELVDCNTDNPGVRIIVKGQVILRTIPQGQFDKPSYIALPVDIFDGVCRTFFSTDDGSLVTNLKDALRFIDGSCIVAQLSCEIDGNQIIISGNIVDKLWKEDNVWVAGIRPYPLPSITVSHEFPNQSLLCNLR